LKTQVIILTVLSILLMLCNLAIQVQTVAFLGAGSERDALFVAMSVPLFLNTLMTTSFGAVTTPLVLSYTGVAQQRHVVFHLLFWLVLASLILTAALLVGRTGLIHLLAPGFGPAQLSHSAGLLGIAVVNIPLQAATSILSGYWIARGRVLRPTASLLLSCAASIGFIAAGAENLTALQVTFALLAGSAFATGAQLLMFILERSDSLHGHPAPPVSPWQIFRGSLPLGAATAVARAGPLVERNIASHLGAGTISVLGYANQLMLFLVNATTSPAATAYYAQMCRDWQDVRKAHLVAFLRRGSALVLCGSLLLSGFFLLGGEAVLQLFQPYTKLTVGDMGELAHYCRILMAAYVALALASFVARPLYAAGKFLQAALFDCLSLGVYALAAVFLGRYYQGTGLALAVVVYGVFHAGLMVRVVSRSLGLALGGRYWWQMAVLVLGWGGIVGIAWQLEALIADRFSGVAQAALGMAVYFIMLVPMLFWVLARQGIDWRNLRAMPEQTSSGPATP
jgi:putative peptidoglycan lipid II flippase